MPSIDRPIYVDVVNGSDVDGTGTERNPFATPARAAELRRTRNWNPNMSRDAYIYVAAGTYEPWELGVEDSGGHNHYVRYVADRPLDTVRVVGGELASGWTVHSGDIYKLAVADPVSTLYENGVRATMARLPVLNPGVDYPCAFAPYFATIGTAFSYTIMEYDPLDFDPTLWDLTELRTFIWSTFGPVSAWFSDLAVANSIDLPTNRLFWDNDGTKFFSRASGPGARYFVAGILEMLTTPGTFVWSAGFLYYWARDGAAPDQDIVIPTEKRLISVVGDDENTRAHHIVFDGFNLSCSAFVSGANGFYRYGTNGSGPQPYDYFNTMLAFRQGAVYLENADHVKVKAVHVDGAGFAGVFMQGAIQYCSVTDSWLEHTGTDGISVNGLAPGEGNVSHNNLFSNNRINNIGQLDGGATGLRLSQSSNNVSRYLHIFQGPRRAYWVHGDFAVPASDNYAFGNALSYTLCEDMMQDSGDAGAIGHSFLSAPPNEPPPPNPLNTVDQVRIIGCNAHPSMLDVAPNGVFFDNHANGACSNVEVSDTQGNQFRTNDAPGPTLTNCSFLSNGNPNPSFDPSLMSPDIGLRPSFPY